MKRRERTFPIAFAITKPTRFSPGDFQMYYAHEWEALQKSLQAGQPAQPTDVPDKPNQPADPVSASPSESSTSSISSTSVYPEKPTAWASKGLPPDFARHARRCSVCLHPDRDAIEGDFIRWRSPELIAKDYKIPDRASIYRHVHSTGLFVWRKRELGRVLEGILESSEHLPLESADVIIRAARIYSHLDDHGNWFEPARITFLLTGPAPAICSPEAFEPPASAPEPESPAAPKAHESSSRHPSTRAAKVAGEQKANRNIRQFKKSVKSMTRKEKANS